MRRLRDALSNVAAAHALSRVMELMMPLRIRANLALQSTVARPASLARNPAGSHVDEHAPGGRFRSCAFARFGPMQVPRSKPCAVLTRQASSASGRRRRSRWAPLDHATARRPALRVFATPCRSGWYHLQPGGRSFPQCRRTLDRRTGDVANRSARCAAQAKRIAVELLVSTTPCQRQRCAARNARCAD